MVGTARLAPTKTQHAKPAGAVKPVVTDKPTARPTPSQVPTGDNSRANVQRYVQDPGKVDAKPADKAELEARRAQANAGGNARGVANKREMPTKDQMQQKVQAEVDAQIDQLKKDKKIPDDVSVEAKVKYVKGDKNKYDVQVDYTMTQPTPTGPHTIKFSNQGTAEGPGQTDSLAQTLAEGAAQQVKKNYNVK